jgi:5-methylcytosine-specific restriction endonuclease McrA
MEALYYGSSLMKPLKTRNGGEWTEARYRGFVKSALRSASQRWPPRYKALDAAYVGKKINPASGRLAKHYHCNKCQEDFPQKEVEVNHLTPVVPISGFDSWDGVIERLFCEQERLEVLCKPCHKALTKQENEERKSHE